MENTTPIATARGSDRENAGEAAKEVDEAIKICDARGTTYNDAVEGKKKLSQP